MTTLLRSNIGLVVWLGIFFIAAVVMALSAYLMSARGVSLKPLWWFAGYLLLIGLPQLAYHAYVAVLTARTPAPAAIAGDRADSRIDNPATLFATVPDGATVVDIPPQGASGLFGRAEQGRLLTMPNGDTVMIVRFRSPDEAGRAVGDYLRESGLESSARPDGVGGFVIPGNDGRVARVYAHRDVLVVNTAMETSIRANGGVPPATSVDPMKRWTSSTSGKVVAASVVLVWVVLAAGYFLKGTAWAARIDAKPVERALSASELRERLLALNALDIPFRIEGSNDNELSATWKYADAKWVDLARAHGMRRIHRIRMTLDERSRKVRATDFQSEYDWSAGSGGGNVAWKASTGIVFFQYEHRRVYGLRLDSEGKATPNFSYAYTFDLQEMKSPLVEAVTQAGWRWQPVVWQAPEWLRWLTE